MNKKWSCGGANPFPKWFQWASYVLSNSVPFIGVVSVLSAMAAGISYALIESVHPGVFALAFFAICTVQLSLWIIGDDIRKSKTPDNGDVQDE